MSSLEYRQKKMQAKLFSKSGREVLRDIGSRHAITLSRYQDVVTRYVQKEDRIWACTKTGEYGELMIDIDEDASFFDQYFQFWKSISKPMQIVFFSDNENSQWSDNVFGVKNAYLSNNIGSGSENILYSVDVYPTGVNVLNSFSVWYNTSNVYQSVSVRESSNVFFSKNIMWSSDIRYSSNLIGCHFCIACDGLINQSYCIQNQHYTPEEYEKRKTDILFSLYKDPSAYDKLKVGIINSYNVTWAWLLNCNNVENGYLLKYIDVAKNVYIGDGGDGTKNCIACIDFGLQSIDMYGCALVWYNSSQCYCTTQLATCNNVYYCYDIQNSSFCLWCIGLRNKQYCIFNKQYTKEERYQKVDRIFTKMYNDWILGDFFPGSINPFYFNDTAAYLIDPSFTKEEVTKLGYLWRDEPIKVDIPTGLEVVKTSELSQYEWFENGRWIINPDILKKVITDEEWNSYRIVKMEYDFLVKYSLPLPRKHWLERMKDNFRI